MRKFVKYVLKKLGLGHAHEVAEHERQREAADERYAALKIRERECLERAEAGLAEMAHR